MPISSKERVRIALSHEKADRIPCNALFVPEMQDLLADYFGIDSKIPEGQPALASDLICRIGAILGNDMVKVQAGMESMFYIPSDHDEYVSTWGVKIRRVKNDTGIYTENIGGPLEGDDSLLNSYNIPDPHDPEVYKAPAQIIRDWGKEYWTVGSVQISIFEAAAHLRGLPKVMIDMIDNKDYANALFDKVMQYPLVAASKFTEMGVDMIWCGDDVAMQTGMMISVDMWREFFKPRYASMFEAWKKVNPNVKIAYHSDGDCEPILDDMYEIGLDVINPIQPSCMEPGKIKKRYGKKLAMFGGVDIQYTMPFGTINELEREIKYLCEICGQDGGYIISPSHYLQSDTGVEKVLKYYEFVKKYGQY